VAWDSDLRLVQCGVVSLIAHVRSAVRARVASQPGELYLTHRALRFNNRGTGEPCLRTLRTHHTTDVGEAPGPHVSKGIIGRPATQKWAPPSRPARYPPPYAIALSMTYLQ
jgi:hypothetical protein